jgi:hypothetical protein
MIATATSNPSTGAWVIVGILLLLVIVFMGWIVRRTMRLFRWARRRPEPTEAAAEHEVFARRAQPLNLVLPPERRTRLLPVEEPPVSTYSGTPPPQGKTGLLQRRVLIPVWLWVPLAFLGVYYLIFAPLGFDSYQYGAGIVSSIVVGVWVRRHHRATVLYRTNRAMLVWTRWARKNEPDPEPPQLLTPQPDPGPTAPAL